MTQLKDYTFSKKSNRLDTNNISTNRTAFLNNLGFTKSQISKIKDPLLDKFILQFCSNIEWYQNRLKKERRYRRLYNVISIALLILIPIVILAITDYFSDKQGEASAEAISSTIAAILTSIFAVHKTFASWMEKRKLSSLFHSAGSKLKTRFFEVEENWNDQLPIEVENDNEITLNHLFHQELGQSIGYVREVLDEEQAAYHELISFPKIELANILKSSQQEALNNLTSFQSKAFVRRQDEEQKQYEREQELEEWREKRKLNDAKRDVLEQELFELQSKKDAATAKKEKELLDKEMERLEKQIEEYLYQNLEAEA